MTIYASRAHNGRFAIGRQGSGAIAFYYPPRNPNHYPKPVGLFEGGMRPNGTKDIPKFYEMVWGWDIMTWREFSILKRMWNPLDQLVTVAYLATGIGNPYDPNTADGVHGYSTAWVEAPGVFADEPTYDDFSAILVKGATIKLNKVEWAVYGGNNSTANPSSDTVTHIELFPPL